MIGGLINDHIMMKDIDIKMIDMVKGTMIDIHLWIDMTVMDLIGPMTEDQLMIDIHMIIVLTIILLLMIIGNNAPQFYWKICNVY